MNHKAFARNAELMQRLDKHTTGKSCLYLKRLGDVDQNILEELLGACVDHIRRTYRGALVSPR